MDELVEKVLRIAALVEDRDDALAFRLSRLARTISAAKQTDVKLDSWDDFASWWNQNRSQGLLFSLVDALGSDNPIIGQMKSVMAEQDQLEAKLHDIYLQLKGQQGTLPAEPATTETEPMPEPEPVAAPALDEAPADQADDLDALLDEEKGASTRQAAYTCDGRKFDTLDAAKAYAEKVFQTEGIVLGIEAVKPSGKKKSPPPLKAGRPSTT